MEIKITFIKKREQAKGEIPFPDYATVKISGTASVVKDLYDKIQKSSEEYEVT